MIHKYVIGVDEAGCGALAGPLIVSAVAFRGDATRPSTAWHGLQADKTLVAGDSKGVKDSGQREALATAIQDACVAFSTIERSSTDIDARLLSTVLPEATQLAALRCLERLRAIDPTLGAIDVLVLIDGDVPKPELPCEARCLPDGDKIDWRIGSASILAKATHDRRIMALHAEYPNWGFDRSRGYPTKEHKALLRERGPMMAHRKSFRPVREAMPRTEGIEE